MLVFAFGLRLHFKTRCFKTRILGRRLPNGKPQERLQSRALRSKTLAFKKRIAMFLFLRFKDFPRGQGLRLGPLRSKNAVFCVCDLKPTKSSTMKTATWHRSMYTIGCCFAPPSCRYDIPAFLSCMICLKLTKTD